MNSHALMFRCFSKSLQVHLEATAERERWESYTGLPLRIIFQAFAPDIPTADPIFDRLVQTYRDEMHLIHDDWLTLYEGVPEMVHALSHSRVTMAVVTTKFRRSAERHLQLFGLGSLFDLIVSGDDCVHHKPHPEPFLRALAGLQSTPSESLVVGDSRYDMEGAKAAGLACAAACWGAIRLPDLLAAEPDYILWRPRQILEPLQRIPATQLEKAAAVPPA